jgi:hypothetical protein
MISQVMIDGDDDSIAMKSTCNERSQKKVRKNKKIKNKTKIPGADVDFAQS